jgi:ankyrin repeat protein
VHKQEGQQKLGNFTQFSVLVIEITNAGRLEGTDINTRGMDCDNALQAASCHGTADTVCFLLGHGADVNARGGKYLTALIAASHRCRVENVRTLLEHEHRSLGLGACLGGAALAHRLSYLR